MDYKRKLRTIKAKAKHYNIAIGETKVGFVYQIDQHWFPKAGCYAVFRDGVCLYVGRSVNVSRRAMSHFFCGQGFRQWCCSGHLKFAAPKAPDDSEIVAIQCDDHKMLEHLLILELVPSFNVKMRGVPMVQ